MKCIILAGGSGNRLWPLSRKNFPKQFMEIRKGRSMFQEAVLRNMPFCDEFIVITNKRYENIARGQLQAFQSLNYTLFLEEKPLKTAPAVITVALYANPDEELLIVSTDHIIEGEYNPCITKAKMIVKENKIAVVGVRPTDDVPAYHFLDCSAKKTKFSSKRTKNSYFDCGIYAAKASVILQGTDPEYVERCRNMGIKDNVFVGYEDSLVCGLDKVINCNYVEVVEAHFNWTRITDMSSYYRFVGTSYNGPLNSIEYNNKNVEIVNTSKQLVVANGLKDVLIANTPDALYVTQIDKEGQIKEIAVANPEQDKYFEECTIFYEKWGSIETLDSTDKCELSRITLFPGRSIISTVGEGYTLNFLITEGSVKIFTQAKSGKNYSKNSMVSLKSLSEFEILNDGKENAVIIQAKNMDLSDIKKLKPTEHECLVRLKPVFHETIWGGTKIRDVLKKNVGNMQNVAESWELSAHPSGQSVIATGKYKGLTLSQYLSTIGKEQLGWKMQGYERFPLMVKFIDAKQSLSIQVHPNDEYAFMVEGDYGKNEMWYIMDADEDACIYVGFNKDVTVEEIKKRIRNDTLVDVLNKIPVKKGETYFLRSGTVHAIGAGCFICEIQQSSNVTYRIYDYNRRDTNGRPRELHLDKALDVVDLHKSETNLSTNYPTTNFDSYSTKLIGQCKYFSVNKYDINGTLKLLPSESTFQVVIVIDGKCKIGNGSLTYPSKIGDTWFCGSWDTIELSGKCSVLVVNI